MDPMDMEMGLNIIKHNVIINHLRPTRWCPSELFTLS